MAGVIKPYCNTSKWLSRWCSGSKVGVKGSTISANANKPNVRSWPGENISKWWALEDEARSECKKTSSMREHMVK